MNPKDTQEYVKLRAAAMMFLEAERKYNTWIDDRRMGRLGNIIDWDEISKLGTHLDAARSVLWDVINDKDLTKQS